jgi:hypothetical protein
MRFRRLSSNGSNDEIRVFTSKRSCCFVTSRGSPERRVGTNPWCLRDPRQGSSGYTEPRDRRTTRASCACNRGFWPRTSRTRARGRRRAEPACRYAARNDWYETVAKCAPSDAAFGHLASEQRRGSVSMPNSVPCVIIPHDLFVEYQDRRREKAVQPIEPDSPRAIDGGDMSRRPPVALSEPPSKGQC